MFGICLTLLTYGLSLTTGAQAADNVEFAKPASVPEKRTLHVVTPTLSRAQTKTEAAKTQKSEAFNSASEKYIPSVAQQAIEHSPLLDTCSNDCATKSLSVPTATPTLEIYPTNPPEVTPTYPFPSVNPCPPYRDQKLNTLNAQDHRDFIPCLDVY